MFVSVHAVGGAPYRLMKKGNPAYDVSIAQVTAARSIARASGLAYDVTAITSADGGGDHVDKNTHLADRPRRVAARLRDGHRGDHRPERHDPPLQHAVLELDRVRPDEPHPARAAPRARRASRQGDRRRPSLCVPVRTGRRAPHERGLPPDGRVLRARVSPGRRRARHLGAPAPEDGHAHRRGDHRSLPRARAAARPRHDARDESWQHGLRVRGRRARAARPSRPSR